MVKLLLEAGADTNIKDNVGFMTQIKTTLQ